MSQRCFRNTLGDWNEPEPSQHPESPETLGREGLAVANGVTEHLSASGEGDAGLYVGQAAVPFIHWRAMRFCQNRAKDSEGTLEQEDWNRKAQEHAGAAVAAAEQCAVESRRDRKQKPSFLNGPCGPLALAAVLRYREGDVERCRRHVGHMLAVYDTHLEDELLFGCVPGGR